MTIRVQIMGGLGNQIFCWAGAHELFSKFNKKISLIYIEDANTRRDRPLELEKIIPYCTHDINIKRSRMLGLLFRFIDKFRLESNPYSRRLLNFLGVYTFQSPTSTLEFQSSSPRIIRSYFQRRDIVDSSWPEIAFEINECIRQVNKTSQFQVENHAAIHVRRGDTLNLLKTQGVLSEAYYQKNLYANKQHFICTDEMNLAEKMNEYLNPIRIFTPRDSSAWETLTLLTHNSGLLGSNSTLSWWAAYIRSKTGNFNSILPIPWNPVDLGYQSALHINGVDYRKAEFINE